MPDKITVRLLPDGGFEVREIYYNEDGRESIDVSYDEPQPVASTIHTGFGNILQGFWPDIPTAPTDALENGV